MRYITLQRVHDSASFFSDLENDSAGLPLVDDGGLQIVGNHIYPSDLSPVPYREKIFCAEVRMQSFKIENRGDEAVFLTDDEKRPDALKVLLDKIEEVGSPLESTVACLHDFQLVPLFDPDGKNAYWQARAYVVFYRNCKG